MFFVALRVRVAPFWNVRDETQKRVSSTMVMRSVGTGLTS